MKQVVFITATILGVAVTMLALWQMAEAVQLLLISLAVAASVMPDVQRLMRRGLSRSRAIGLSYLLVFGLLTIVLAAFAALAYGEIATVLSEAPRWYENTRAALAAQSDWRVMLGQNLPALDSLTDASGSGGTSAFAVVAWTVQSLLSTLILIFAVASLAFYWLLDEARITRLWLSLLPLQVRVPARAMWEQIYREVGLFLRGEVITVILSAFALMCVYTIAGVPAAVSLGLIGGLLMVVPVLGIPLALIPSGLVALTQSYPAFFIALALGLTALLIIKHLIGPRVFKGALRVNPVLQVVVIMALANTVGIVYILFAPPLAAAIQTAAHVWVTDFRQMMQRSGASQMKDIETNLRQLEARVTPDYGGYDQYRTLIQRARKLIASTAEKVPQELSATGDASRATPSERDARVTA